tara:strand:+ start:1396 stop:1998 length:603 start_codon:yes stop_codon:yes gene_type:complete
MTNNELKRKTKAELLDHIECLEQIISDCRQGESDLRISMVNIIEKRNNALQTLDIVSYEGLDDALRRYDFVSADNFYENLRDNEYELQDLVAGSISDEVESQIEDIDWSYHGLITEDNLQDEMERYAMDPSSLLSEALDNVCEDGKTKVADLIIQLQNDGLLTTPMEELKSILAGFASQLNDCASMMMTVLNGGDDNGAE